MDVLMIVILGLFGLMTLGIFVLIAKSRASYKHPAIIAVQTGTEVNDVVLVSDKARVRETEDGYYILEFKTLKHDRMPSPPFKWWHKFIRSGAGYDPQDTSRDGRVARESRFSEKQVRRLLTRGILLYKTSEGELKPATWTSEGKLSILDQDNRAFLIADAERRAKLNRTKFDRWAPYITTGVIVIVMGLIFAFYLVYLNTNLAENIGAICSGAQQAGGGLVDAAQSVLPGG